MPLYIHRLHGDESFVGPVFATINEDDERTVISSTRGISAEGPYSRITTGPFDLTLIGILAKLSCALAKAEVPIFVISTYRYDHILIPKELEDKAVDALQSAGFSRKA
jgi:hypothetical protein